MINICVVGWYGTETLGDMAIFDGIIKIFRNIDRNVNVFLGSLFPFYSEREIYENFFLYTSGMGKLNISVFDIRDKKAVHGVLSKIDILIFGGGPLMDFEELYPSKNIFQLAYKNNIPSVVLGCGFGPIHLPKYLDVVNEMFDCANLIIFRDRESVTLAKGLLDKTRDYYCIGDPAVISIEEYQQTHLALKNNAIAINLREFPQDEYGKEGILEDCEIVEMLRMIADTFELIELVPMHTFEIGKDDRIYLSRIRKTVERNNIKIHYKPTSLSELYEIYQSAFGTIGMRYHSVVMQTILNGNNYIINYTDSKVGKTVGFLNNIGAADFYSESITNLKNKEKLDPQKIINCLKNKKNFNCKKSDYLERYVYMINKVLRGECLTNGE